MSNLQIFNYGRHPMRPIRTTQREGEVWFVLKDVCGVLGIRNTTAVTKRLEEDEVATLDLENLAGEVSIINEPGLYSVLLQSDKPEAKEFKRWVAHTVLPSIRKAGACAPPSTVALADSDAPYVETRVLSSDDYLDAARIVAGCQRQKLPYVLGLLETGGWHVEKVLDVAGVEDETFVPISEIIQGFLASQQMTSAALAGLLGIGIHDISRYKNGKRTPRPEKYRELVEKLRAIEAERGRG